MASERVLPAAAHRADCQWERTTEAECEYRATHHYCPHPEHACTCLTKTFPLPTADALSGAIADTLSDAAINHIVTQYNLRYEELSEDDFGGGMSISEKHQRSCIAVRAAMRHYFQTGEFVHWRDAKSAHDSRPS